MSIINEHRKNDNRPIHPIVNRCQQLVANGYTLETVRFCRERQGPIFATAIFYINFVKLDAPSVSFDSEWNADINTWLLDNGGKAESIPNEIERMGFSLVEALRESPYEFGKDYTNAVLLEILHANFDNKNEIANALKQISYTTPSEQSVYYARAHDFIETQFKNIITILGKQLEYSSIDTETILCGSIVYMLDERFSITNRKNLGIL